MDPKRKLKGMLARIFSDAVAEPIEREEIVHVLELDVDTLPEEWVSALA